MSKSTKENLINDIENRLNDFFSEDEAQIPKTAGASGETLEKLKSAILSIDWEITDSCLEDLIREVEILLDQYQDDRFIHALLRMLKSLGRYIRKRKAQSHPNAVNRVMTIFTSLEKLLKNQDVDKIERKLMLAKEINAFKKLKEQVIAQKTADMACPAPAEEEIASTPQDFEQTVKAVEARIKLEVDALKIKVVSLQEELNKLRKD